MAKNTTQHPRQKEIDIVVENLELKTQLAVATERVKWLESEMNKINLLLTDSMNLLNKISNG